MRIDQRNVGQSIVANNNAYVTDRWLLLSTFANVGTAQQLSANPPPGQTHYLTWTNSATASTSTAEKGALRTSIECNSTVAYAYGSSTAQNTVMSFWVNVSVAGNYSLTIANTNQTYGYATSYTVVSPNTWQRIVLPIPPAFGGTWRSDNTSNFLYFGWHGTTSNSVVPSSAMNAWTSTTGAMTNDVVNLGLTASSTFSITGIQWELGTNPTRFEHRPGAVEMQLCQRYYEKSYEEKTAVNTSTLVGAVSAVAAATNGLPGPSYQVPKRTATSIFIRIISPKGTTHATATWASGTGTDITLPSGGFGTSVTGSSAARITQINASGLTQGSTYLYHYTIDAES